MVPPEQQHASRQATGPRQGHQPGQPGKPVPRFGMPELVSAVQLLEQVFENLEERYELLLRAIEEARIATPGLEKQTYRHPVSPHGKALLKHVTLTLASQPHILKSIQIALVRFQQAQKHLAAAREAIRSNRERPELVSTLRTDCHLLTSLGEAVREDYVLSQMFPSARQVPGSRAAATTSLLPSGTTALKQPQTSPADRRRLSAEGLLRSLAPFFTTLLPLRRQPGDPAPSLASLATSGWPGIRLLGLRMLAAPETMDLIQTFLAEFDTLRTVLGQPDTPFFREVSALTQTVARCQEHPLLRDLLDSTRPT